MDDLMIQTAIIILGSALADRIPHGHLLQGGGDAGMFYYDIVLGETLDASFLTHIESRMREIIQGNSVIKHHEMCLSNACDFFSHHQRFYPVHILRHRHQNPLVDVVVFNGFTDVVKGECASQTGELVFDQLVEIEPRPVLSIHGKEKNVYRVWGRILPGIKKIDPYRTAQRLGLIHVIQKRGKDFLEAPLITWFSRGEEVLFSTYSKWRTLHLKDDFSLIAGSGGKEKELRCAQWFMNQGQWRDECIVRTTEDQEEFLKELVGCLSRINQLSWGESLWKGNAPVFIKKRLSQHFSVSWRDGKGIAFESEYSWLTAIKDQQGFVIKYGAFVSLGKAVLSILSDSKKDLSQKKEILGILSDCEKRDKHF